MADVRLLLDAKHWHDRAEEARTLADQALESEVKRILLGIVESYERLAAHAQRWQEGHKD
jgi:hypothetical protein